MKQKEKALNLLKLRSLHFTVIHSGLMIFMFCFMMMILALFYLFLGKHAHSNYGILDWLV